MYHKDYEKSTNHRIIWTRWFLPIELCEKRYEVHGTIRRSSTINTSRIDNIISEYESDGQLCLYYLDLLDSSSISNLISSISPDEIYNLANHM